MQLIAQDTVTAPDPEAKFEQERNDAYDAVHHWPAPDGTLRELYGYASEREFLFWSLVDLDGGIDWRAIAEEKDSTGKVIRVGNPRLLLPHAVKMLWLCLHTREEVRPFRQDKLRLIETIEAWAVEWVPPDRQAEAINLTMKLIHEADVNRAIPRPSDTGLKAGN